MFYYSYHPSPFTIHHSPFTNFSIVLIFSLYHFVNSPFGIIVQNALIVIFTFFYPSIFTMILLILSTLNMSLSNPDKFENGKVSWIVISPQSWTQSIMLMYVISFSSTCHISDNLVIWWLWLSSTIFSLLVLLNSSLLIPLSTICWLEVKLILNPFISPFMDLFYLWAYSQRYDNDNDTDTDTDNE